MGLELIKKTKFSQSSKILSNTDAACWHYTYVARIYVGVGSGACLRALEALGFLVLKYAFFHILETPFYKNRTLHCTLINLQYLYVTTHFGKNLHFLIFTICIVVAAR